MDDFYTVDQLAQILDLHPRTIRRYIRENRLKALKVGGEWRIRKEDAEMFIGGKLKQLNAEAKDEIVAFLDGQPPETGGKLQVCAVLDCYVANPEAMQLSQIIMQYMNQPDPERGKAKFQYMYDDREKKGRYILWGNPGFVGKVLSAVSQAVQA